MSWWRFIQIPRSSLLPWDSYSEPTQASYSPSLPQLRHGIHPLPWISPKPPAQARVCVVGFFLGLRALCGYLSCSSISAALSSDHSGHRRGMAMAEDQGVRCVPRFSSSHPLFILWSPRWQPKTPWWLWQMSTWDRRDQQGETLNRESLPPPPVSKGKEWTMQAQSKTCFRSKLANLGSATCWLCGLGQGSPRAGVPNPRGMDQYWSMAC